MRDFLRRLWRGEPRPDTGPVAEEITALSDQFRITLRASAAKIEETDRSRDVLAHIHRLLAKEEWHWKDAYEVEQQIVHLFDEQALQTELSRRVLEAQQVLSPAAAAWYAQRLVEAADAASQRALLLRLVNDLQWRYTVNEAKLGFVKQITGRTGQIFILAMAIFIAFLFFVFIGDSGQWGTWWGPSSRFITFLLAAVSGFLGASFSMVAGLKTRVESSGLNELKNSNSWPILLSRVLVGTGAALILYFFFESQLLAGELFPTMPFVFPDEPAFEQWANGITERALLIVWCVIAGFSEKLVPRLLARTEARVADATQTLAHGHGGRQVREPSRSVAAAPGEPRAGAAPAAEAASSPIEEAEGTAEDG